MFKFTLLCLLLVCGPALAQTSPDYRSAALALLASCESTLDVAGKDESVIQAKDKALTTAQKSFAAKYKTYRVSGKAPASYVPVVGMPVNVTLALLDQQMVSSEKDPAKAKKMKGSLQACRTQIKKLAQQVKLGQ